MTFTITEKTMTKIRITQKLDDEVITRSQASEALGVCERTIFRYLKALREKWPPWLIHGLQGKPSNYQPDPGRMNRLHKYVMLKKFSWFWPTFLSQKVEEIYGLTVNHETLRQWMVKWGLWVVNKRRNKITRTLRERRPQYWMLIQFDWSYHDWLENGQAMCMLSAVDDATSDLVHAQFTKWESLDDILPFRLEYMKRNGKPQAIYVDCHASYKVNHPQDQFDEEMKTRFERWMRKLGVIVIFAKSPQWKWRVERWFRTHQDRLIKEMRLEGIKTYAEANIYLDKKYREKHNKMFWVESKEAWDEHQKLTKEEEQNIDWYFWIETERTVKKDGTISYKKVRYQLEKGQVLSNYKTITVYESTSWQIRLCSWKQELRFKKVWYK